MSVSLKMLLYLSFTASLFLVKTTPLALSIITASVILLLIYPDRKMRRGMIPVILFILTNFLGNLFFYPGRVLMEIGPLTITGDSLRIASIRSARVSGLIVGAKVLTLTSPIEEILNVLRRLLLPLEKIKVPVSEFFEIASLTLKLLPGIKAEALESYRKGIREAKKDGFLQRLGIIVTLMFPLMIKTIQSPSDLLSKNSDIQDPELKAVEGGPFGDK